MKKILYILKMTQENKRKYEDISSILFGHWNN